MQKLISSIISVLGMLVALGIANAIDNWIPRLRRASLQDFRGPLDWLIPANLAVLLLAGLLLAGLWFWHNKIQPGIIVALIYALVGLGVLFYSSMAIALGPGVPLPMSLAIVPQSLTAVTSALVAAIGLQRLILRRAAL